MTLDAMQGVAARLLAEPGFLARFRAAPDATLAGFDLTGEEARTLRRLDLSRIGMVCEGYAGKRAERVESAFPWTLRALGPQARPIIDAHLAAVPAGAPEAEELVAFAAHAARVVTPAWRRRLVEDLLDAEAALRAAASPARRGEARWSAGLRLRLASGIALVRTRGDLALALEAGPAVADYPESPAHALVRLTSRGLSAEPLDEASASLLDACRGGASVSETARDPAEEARLRLWYAAGVLEPAA